MSNIELLLKIRDLQVKSSSTSFNKGLFPSYRTNTVLRLTREDDNIFFSVSLVYILQSLLPYFSEQEKIILKDIEADLMPNLYLYANKPERHSFNFWQKKPNKHFPNGTLLNVLDKFQLPDDIDTTSIVQMVSGVSKENALKTKAALENHVNGQSVWIKNGHKQLRGFRAYSTWFGENMPIEFDVCVLSNYLLWVKSMDFPLNSYDKESILLIKETIKYALYFVSGFKSAPEYPKVEVILYHLSRLASVSSFIDENDKEKLILDIQAQLNRTTDVFSKMLLKTSLLKLGVKSKNQMQNIESNTESSWWFTAGLLSVYSNPIIEKLAPYSLFHFRFVCPAFNYALVLENRILNGY